MATAFHSTVYTARCQCHVGKLPPFHAVSPSSRLFSARAAAADSGGGAVTTRATRSPIETRVSLVIALASQAANTTRRVLSELAAETVKYAFPRRFEPRNLEEALMSVPDLETVEFKVLKRTKLYDIREIEPYFIAETTMPGNSGFDFNGSSQAFNALAGYLFGKNTKKESMAMTTPVYTRKEASQSEKMDMTTPVITKRTENKWQMSFVLPSKYGSNFPVPEDSSIKIVEVPRKIVAVTAFSGFVSDDEVKYRESRLREELKFDTEYELKQNTSVEVAQFNPPFTLPFTRRNEISLEVERKTKSE